MAAGIPGLPASLKSIQPYLKVAKEYEKRDPIVAYYCEYLERFVGFRDVVY
jgi:hypothetical protein